MKSTNSLHLPLLSTCSNLSGRLYLKKEIMVISESKLNCTLIHISSFSLRKLINLNLNKANKINVEKICFKRRMSNSGADQKHFFFFFSHFPLSLRRNKLCFTHNTCLWRFKTRKRKQKRQEFLSCQYGKIILK